MKFRKRPVIIDATHWFKNGDHPLDGNESFEGVHGIKYRCQGKVVRYYRTPDRSGEMKCQKCNDEYNNHGWVDTLEGGHIVCPGDWIITGVHGEYYPCKPEIFEKTYEKVEDA